MPAMSDPKALCEFALFQDLTPEQLSWLNDHLRLKSFPAQTNIILEEQPGETVYIILRGAIKIFVDQADGTEVILAILGPGHTVGELSLLDSAGRSANVFALEPSCLLWMDRSVFWQCLGMMPTLTYKMAEVVCSRLRLANEQIKALAGLDIGGRVARQILAMAEQHGQLADNGDTLIPIRLTQGDIAGFIGASRERVNQVIVDYKQHRYISVDQHHHITVHNKQALAQRCL